MKRLVLGLIALLLALQLGVILIGCANTSQSSSSQMANSSKLSIVVKDAATGAKVPMTGIFSNKTAVSAASAKGIKAKAVDPNWDQTQTNNMGYAEVPDLKTDNQVMIKIDNSANSYESYSKVVNVGKNITGLTVYITTDESAAPSYDVAFDPTAPTSVLSGGTFTCSNAATCMSCGCPTGGGSGCGGGCGCTDPNTNCAGGSCRTSAGVGSFGKCNDGGCPTGCRGCGACECTAAGGCGGSTNCQVTNTGTVGAGGGGCTDSGCPTGCRGCGACSCSSAGGCGGSANCTGGSQTNFAGAGGGRCTDTGCPTGCRNCGSCACTAAGGCGGSANCASSGGGGSGGAGGIVGPGCSGSGCPTGCSNCHACVCANGTGGCGGSSHCMP